jgi:hypothetical protein
MQQVMLVVAGAAVASPTARRDLQTVHDSAVQQNTPPEQRTTVYQDDGYSGQAAHGQMQSVCMYLFRSISGQALYSIFFLIQINV